MKQLDDFRWGDSTVRLIDSVECVVRIEIGISLIRDSLERGEMPNVRNVSGEKRVIEIASQNDCRNGTVRAPPNVNNGVVHSAIANVVTNPVHVFTLSESWFVVSLRSWRL